MGCCQQNAKVNLPQSIKKHQQNRNDNTMKQQIKQQTLAQIIENKNINEDNISLPVLENIQINENNNQLIIQNINQGKSSNEIKKQTITSSKLKQTNKQTSISSIYLNKSAFKIQSTDQSYFKQKIQNTTTPNRLNKHATNDNLQTSRTNKKFIKQIQTKKQQSPNKKTISDINKSDKMLRSLIKISLQA